MRRLTVLLMAVLVAAPAFAAPRISAPLDREPPEPIYEVTQPERPGYVWNPGVWKWDGKRMVWNSGNWIAKRPGYSWVPDGWEKRADKWYFAPGFWVADNVADAPAPEPLDALSEAQGNSAEPAAAPVKLKYVPKAVKKNGAARKQQPDYSNKKIWTRYINH